ncbi:hypothetical protein CXB51_009159 [Gossypium anomalum]|uniref:Uncharacterized protein n=1 Tax=Gossypium anomalum TaxID=47600 RepID=A0A8J5Z7N7_9ROSI|nr:hypothetical protein CXB51_009159 [Gossypium anomalum]
MTNAKSVRTPMVSSPILTSLVGTPLDDGTTYRQAHDIHWSVVKRILWYVRGTLDHGIVFHPSKITLTGFSNADWASCLEDRKSTSGYCVYLGDNLIVEIKLPGPPVVWCDNSSTVLLAANPVLHAQVKHVELDLHFIWDKVLSVNLQVNYVPGRDQIADILNKPLTIGSFAQCRDKLNVISLTIFCTSAGEISVDVSIAINRSN